MSRDPKQNPLPKTLEPGMTQTASMSGEAIVEHEQDVLLQFINLPKGAITPERAEIKTCPGNIRLVVNVLNDYANILESAVEEWGLTGFHAALYADHAERCRKVAKKLAEGIGYDYDASVEKCQERMEKESKRPETGVDGLSAIFQRQQPKGKSSQHPS